MKDKAEGQWVGRVEKLFKQFLFGAASLKEGDRDFVLRKAILYPPPSRLPCYVFCTCMLT